MPELTTDDATLHVEIDGSGDPVTVFAHGLTNSAHELAAFTPFLEGTKVRFDFRGHGHSSVPDAGHYRFADFARRSRRRGDGVRGDARGRHVARRRRDHQPHRAPSRIASSGSCSCSRPRSMFRSRTIADFDRTAELLESLPEDQAIEAILVVARPRPDLRTRARGSASSTCCCGRT